MHQLELTLISELTLFFPLKPFNLSDKNNLNLHVQKSHCRSNIFTFQSTGNSGSICGSFKLKTKKAGIHSFLLDVQHEMDSE